MFEELLRRVPDMELDGPVVRLRSNFINGIKRMPVSFTPTRRRAEEPTPRPVHEGGSVFGPYRTENTAT
jgi:hypothetical protein